jgi:class 3 adenylate cyclase
VNKIGSLVHESVYRYGGCANKNIGEAFLLVWKIPE